MIAIIKWNLNLKTISSYAVLSLYVFSLYPNIFLEILRIFILTPRYLRCQEI